MLSALRPALCLGVLLGTLSVSLSAQGGPPGLPPVPVPQGNPITLEKTLLGKALFWDEQLSSTGTAACGTCHIPGAGGADPRSLTPGGGSTHPGPDDLFGTPDDIRGSRGVVLADANGEYQSAEPFVLREQVTGRQPPSMINAAYSPLQFWDGRAGGTFVNPVSGGIVLQNGGALESQAVGPPLSDVEMGHLGRDWDDVTTRLASVQPLALAEDIPALLQVWIDGRDYPALFAEAFPQSNGQLTAARMALAIATYERTLISDETPFDAFLAGQPGALTPQQNQGRQIFNGAGRCNLCHVGPLFTDHVFRNIGVRPLAEDLGRGAITGVPQDNGRFKTPGLRNVGLRAPYFHNGGMQTLEEVVDFYDRGGDFGQNQSPLIIPLGLSPPQKNALVAFLEGALTDPRVAAETAPFDRPTLYAESARRPVNFGVGGAGAGGFVPRAVALEPPLIGNPNMTVAIADGHAGAALILGLDLVAGPPFVTVREAPFHLGGTSAMKFFAAGTLAGDGAGNGWASVPVAIPADPALDGMAVFTQWFVLDRGAPQGLASSEGTRFEFFE